MVVIIKIISCHPQQDGEITVLENYYKAPVSIAWVTHPVFTINPPEESAQDRLRHDIKILSQPFLPVLLFLTHPGHKPTDFPNRVFGFGNYHHSSPFRVH